MAVNKVAPVGSTAQQQPLLSTTSLVLAGGGTPKPQSNSVDPRGPPQSRPLPTSSTAYASSIPLSKSDKVKVEVVVKDEQRAKLRTVEDSHRQETTGGKETETDVISSAPTKAITRGSVLSSCRRCNAPDCYVSTRWACRCQICRKYDKNGVIICHKCFANPAQHEKAADARHNMAYYKGRWKHPVPWPSVLAETTPPAVSTERQQPLLSTTPSVIAGGAPDKQANSVNPRDGSQPQHFPTLSSSSSSSTPCEASSIHVVGHAASVANKPETSAKRDAGASPIVDHGDATATKRSSERECNAEHPSPYEHQSKRVRHFETDINKDDRNSSPFKSKPEDGLEVVVKSEQQDLIAGKYSVGKEPKQM